MRTHHAAKHNKQAPLVQCELAAECEHKGCLHMSPHQHYCQCRPSYCRQTMRETKCLPVKETK